MLDSPLPFDYRPKSPNGVPSLNYTAVAFGEERGQPWSDEPDEFIGNVQVIEIDEARFTGAADPARDGLAVGVDLEE